MNSSQNKKSTTTLLIGPEDITQLANKLQQDLGVVRFEEFKIKLSDKVLTYINTKLEQVGHASNILRLPERVEYWIRTEVMARVPDGVRRTVTGQMAQALDLKSLYPAKRGGVLHGRTTAHA